MGGGQTALPGDSWNASLRNATHHHTPSTRDRAGCESASGRETVNTRPAATTGPLERDIVFCEEERAQPPLLSSRLLTTGSTPTYTWDRLASSTAREQSSLTEARRGALGEEGDGVKGKAWVPGQTPTGQPPPPTLKWPGEGGLIPTLG